MAKKKCRHKKGIILASACSVEFFPDQEPFTAGVVERCGIESIVADAINIHWCPKCKVAQDVESDGDWESYEG